MASGDMGLGDSRHIWIGSVTGWTRQHDGDWWKLAMNEGKDRKWRFRNCWWIANEDIPKRCRSWLCTICKQFATNEDYEYSLTVRTFITNMTLGNDPGVWRFVECTLWTRTKVLELYVWQIMFFCSTAMHFGIATVTHVKPLCGEYDFKTSCIAFIM